MNSYDYWSETEPRRGADNAFDENANQASNPYEKIASEAWSSLQQAATKFKDSPLPQPPQEISTTVSAAARTLGDSAATLKSILGSLCDASDKKPAGVTSEKKTDWTVALDMTTNFDDDEEGRFYRLDDLTNFAKNTKGKSLTIVVQAAFENAPDKDGKKSFTLERYVVKDGDIKQVSHGPSKGYGQDAQDLLAYTTKNAPSDKLAFIVDSHGLGNKGLFGDTGEIKLPDFIKHVENGLKGSGRAKLDLIHFDTCLMAQSGSMDRVSKIADYMVASPETENTWGISQVPLWDKLVQDSKISPRDFGREIVKQARLQGIERDKDGDRVPMETLSHVDLRKYAQFRKNLDILGDKLVDSLKETGNKDLIEKCIDNSRKYGSGWTGLTSGASWCSMFKDSNGQSFRVDLKDFATNIIKGIEDGQFKDDNRTVKKAAEDLLRSRGDLVDSNYTHGKYDGTGGISVFLPTRNMRNVDREARLMTTAGRLSDLSESANFAKINKDEKSRTEFVNAMKAQISGTKPFWIFGVKGVDDELKALDHAIGGFERASGDESRRLNLARVNRAAHNLELTEPFQKKQEAYRTQLREKVSEVYKLQLIDEKDTSGWAKLRILLADKSKK